ncbi:hypothetical protein FHS89_001901 [Rubricella aquisinus]|uniref:Uncharacterized protein n=1 Tax=Rubricella aquisinus TaxID=2028108 RepID=A0A840WMT1_9RHOB|nr:hypothetical protein [Rubricella aquisinus]MBB5515881.1 hypothetical protein [Rubricella aquisinus]
MDDMRGIALSLTCMLGLSGCAQLGLPQWSLPQFDFSGVSFGGFRLEAPAPEPEPVAEIPIEQIVLPEWLVLAPGTSEEDLRFIYETLVGPAPPGTVEEPPSPVSARFLTHTVAELGPADRPGRWIETLAVTSEAQGWVTDLETGRSTRILLLPRTDGTRDRISVEALTRLGVSSVRLVVTSIHYDTRDLPG